MERQEAGGASPGQVLLLRCAWCERIKVDGAWIAVATVPADRDTRELLEGRSDGICPDCHAKLEPL